FSAWGIVFNILGDYTGQLPTYLWQRLSLHGKYRRKIPHNGRPVISGVRRTIYLPAGRAEIHSTLIERVHRHRVAQYVNVAVPLRQTFRERLPFVSTGPAAVHAQLPIRWEMLGVALDRHDINGFRLMGVNVDYETKI